MTRSTDVAAREAKIAELKHLITTGRYETTEMLEEAVDRLLWSEQDRLEEAHRRQKFAGHDDVLSLRDIARSHPK